MNEKKNPLGPTGETVRRNVARLRGGLQYKELAERLAQLGRPIPALGLRRIEAGERRVDADDLVALAVAFGVSPLTLLMPEDGTRYAWSPLTGVSDREVSHNTQWLWALGEEPLSLPGLGKTEESQRAIALFRSRAKPAIEPRSSSNIADRTIELAPGEDDVDMEIFKGHARRAQRSANIAQGLVPPYGQGLDKYDVEALAAEVTDHGDD